LRTREQMTAKIAVDGEDAKTVASDHLSEEGFPK
jgi:glycine betaine/choline ABC-type transport system substrate-binding protein